MWLYRKHLNILYQEEYRSIGLVHQKQVVMGHSPADTVLLDI